MRIVSYLSEAWEEVDVRKVVIDACLLALLIALGFSARPGYRAYYGYRADRSIKAAKVAASHGDWLTARDQASSALAVRENNFEAYRIWARSLAKLGEACAYTAASHVLADPRATREDQLEFLRVIVSQAPQAVALNLYAGLPKELSGQASFRAAVTPLLIQRDEIELAETSLHEVAKPTDGPDVRLELLHVLCCRPDAGRVAEARRIFADLVAGNASDEALAALPLLAAVPGGLAPGKPLPDLPAWLKQQPNANANHHLLGLDPALEAEPEAEDRCYEVAVKQFLTTSPGPLGAWLIRHRKAEMAAKVLAEPAMSSPDAYLARLRALLVLKQKLPLEAALRKPPAGIDAVEIEIVRAKFAMLRDDSIAAAAAWTRALHSATFVTTRNRFIEIARSAEDCHATDAAENAWVEAFRLGWGPLPRYGDLFPVYASLASKGQSDDLLAMFQVMQGFEPANSELQNNVCYFSLIHGRQTPGQVAAAMGKLVEQEDDPLFHSTLMLAEMLDGRSSDALARVPKLNGSSNVKPMMLTALEGTARILAGETEAGTALLKGVDWRGFMPQERRVFRELLLKPQIPGLPVPDVVSPKVQADSDRMPAWRHAVEHLDKDHASAVHPPNTVSSALFFIGKQASSLLGKTARPACPPMNRQAGSPPVKTGGTPNPVQLAHVLELEVPGRMPGPHVARAFCPPPSSSPVPAPPN